MAGYIALPAWAGFYSMAKDIALSVKLDDSKWDRFTRDLVNSNIPFATSVAINRTAFQTQQAVRQGMEKHYEGGPTRFTKSGILFTKSHKRRLNAMVYINPNRGDYIRITMAGGIVKPGDGARTRVQPVNMRLTKHGNITGRRGPSGKIAKLLAKPKYFSGVPKGMPNDDDHEGVWQRMGRKGGRDSLRMVAHYKRQWRQRPFFPGFQIAQRKIMTTFGPEFYKAIVRATGGRVG